MSAIISIKKYNVSGWVSMIYSYENVQDTTELICGELQGKNVLGHTEYSGSCGPEMASHVFSAEPLNWQRSWSA